MANDQWSSDELQFPRLLAEIRANVGITHMDVQDLLGSMNISREQLDELFERAEVAWERLKARVSGSDASIQLMLDLSTAHMPGPSPDWGGLRVLADGYGTVVFVNGAEDTYGEPEWIRPVMQLARAGDCTIVNFDRDGEICPDLPTWEW